MKVKNLELMLALILAGDLVSNHNVSAFVHHHHRCHSKHAASIGSTTSTASNNNDNNGIASTSTQLGMSTFHQASSSSAPNGLSLQRDPSGIYQVENEADHKALLAAHPDRLVVLKFYAPWCRACKGLAPRYKNIATTDVYQNAVFAELNVQNNRDYVKALGVLALPNVHFYAGNQGLVENFPCGPSKLPILKRKLKEWLLTKADKQTGLLLPAEVRQEQAEVGESEPVRKEALTGDVLQIREQGRDEIYSISDNELRLLREVPFFKDFSAPEFSGLMKTATLQTFEEGAILMRQGMPGNKFYVIQSGEVEIYVKSAFEDPLSTPAGYLGAVINTLGDGNFFGERALITGEERAASIKTTKFTRAFVFDQENIPDSSVLSGKKKASEERIAQVDEKYGNVGTVVFPDQVFKQYSVASQSRGSVNSPRPIVGVDIEEDELVGAPQMTGAPQTFQLDPMTEKRGEIYSLLRRFKLVQMAKKCYEHIEKTRPQFGNVNESYRRSLLLREVSPAQKEEFREVFYLVDQNEDGSIQESELLRVVKSLNAEKEEVIREVPSRVQFPQQKITFDEFMGVMAEAEFYNLFLNTFNALDTYNSGFVRAKDLKNVLCGVRDLISDDRTSIIDSVDSDEDMLVNYEQFTKMMIGSAL
eukprot:CAMPEP_0116040942 /NCGR_PEP_ID=MMETSP0321-20121206/24696_1 /TAXON_ID=163516 /ORGANISM="Leptocylindrus danicus var. danicus, Strain B650" /LENGTH=645 /DNA_ID=CAMNT_0003520927 /DNA_START=100 /DNA_END=2037 /DNA_ORIENTATION=-